jgi:hypothetical protein
VGSEKTKTPWLVTAFFWGEQMKQKMKVLVEHETGGGHGAYDAAEEGLRNVIELGPYRVLDIKTAKDTVNIRFEIARNDREIVAQIYSYLRIYRDAIDVDVTKFVVTEQKIFIVLTTDTEKCVRPFQEMVEYLKKKELKFEGTMGPFYSTVEFEKELEE